MLLPFFSACSFLIVFSFSSSCPSKSDQNEEMAAHRQRAAADAEALSPRQENTMLKDNVFRLELEKMADQREQQREALLLNNLEVFKANLERSEKLSQKEDTHHGHMQIMLLKDVHAKLGSNPKEKPKKLQGSGLSGQLKLAQEELKSVLEKLIFILKALHFG